MWVLVIISIGYAIWKIGDVAERDNQNRIDREEYLRKWRANDCKPLSRKVPVVVREFVNPNAAVVEKCPQPVSSNGRIYSRDEYDYIGYLIEKAEQQEKVTKVGVKAIKPVVKVPEWFIDKWVGKIDLANSGIECILQFNLNNKMSSKIADYSGKKYHRLTVQKCIVPSNKNNEGGKWECQCDCGSMITIKGYELHWKRSCGCARAEGHLKAGRNHRKPENATLKYKYKVHKASCVKNDRQFLSMEEWVKIAKSPCNYCGTTDTVNLTDRKNYRRVTSKTLTEEIAKMYEIKINGIDRVDSSKGYEIDNCVPCCTMCNKMKNSYPLGLFMEKIKRIYERHYNADWFITPFGQQAQISPAEQLIIDELEKYDIKWEREVSFRAMPLTDKGANYRYDFLLVDHGIVLEYDSALWHADTQRLTVDAIKNQFCIDNGIEVIRYTSKHYYNMTYHIKELMTRLGVRKLIATC